MGATHPITSLLAGLGVLVLAAGGRRHPLASDLYVSVGRVFCVLPHRAREPNPFVAGK